MKVGIPSEVKNREYRVALTPAGVHHLVGSGHDVLVQAGAGMGSAISDDDYRAAGAAVVGDAAEVWARSELVCKVKEPVASEYGYLRDDLVLFTYLHLAADRPATDALLAAGTTSIAYETVQLPDGSLPLLAPMSEVAGRLSTQVGAYHLMKNEGGSGVLLGGVPGVDAAKVVVLGGGVVGRHAAEIAVGMRADVAVLDLSLPRLREIDTVFGGRVRTVASSAYAVERELLDADLVIGAVLVTGARAPRLVSNELVSRMKPGSVLVDVAVDQGGCFEDTRRDHARRPDLPCARLRLLLRRQHAGGRPRDVHACADQRDVAVPLRAGGSRVGRRLGRPSFARTRPDHARGTLRNSAVAEAHGYEEALAAR